jgi:hypothetical protein
MNKPGHTTTVAEFIANRMTAIGKTSHDIATEIGAPNHNVVSMILQGVVKLPINLVGTLAHALDTDLAHLMRLTLREYAPDLLEAVENGLQRPLLSANEVALIDRFRAVTGDRDVRGVMIERDGLLEVIVLQGA